MISALLASGALDAAGALAATVAWSVGCDGVEGLFLVFREADPLWLAVRKFVSVWVSVGFGRAIRVDDGRGGWETYYW